jgi:hypothetical protein
MRKCLKCLKLERIKNGMGIGYSWEWEFGAGRERLEIFGAEQRFHLGLIMGTYWGGRVGVRKGAEGRGSAYSA